MRFGNAYSFIEVSEDLVSVFIGDNRAGGCILETTPGKFIGVKRSLYNAFRLDSEWAKAVDYCKSFVMSSEDIKFEIYEHLIDTGRDLGYLGLPERLWSVKRQLQDFGLFKGTYSDVAQAVVHIDDFIALGRGGIIGYYEEAYVKITDCTTQENVPVWFKKRVSDRNRKDQILAKLTNEEKEILGLN